MGQSLPISFIFFNKKHFAHKMVIKLYHNINRLHFEFHSPLCCASTETGKGLPFFVQCG
jgi:hypothetical protein